MTQSEMQGVHLARRQSIMALYISSCDCVYCWGCAWGISVWGPTSGQHMDSIQFSPADKPVTYARTLFLMEKLMKLVSTNTRKGGPSAVLYWKNMPVGTASLFVCCGVMVSAHTHDVAWRRPWHGRFLEL